MYLTVTIEKLVHGGLGLARTDKGVLFVEDVLPGERVKASVIHSVGGQPLAKSYAIESPSPHRRRPPCDFFGACGGCDWLYGSYEAQLANKKAIFLDCLHRIGKTTKIPAMEVFSSPEFGYRQRAQFKIDPSRKTIGFYKRKSRDIVHIAFCPLLRAELNTFLSNMRELLPRTPKNIDQIKCIVGKEAVIASAPVIKPLTSPLTTIQTGKFVFAVSGNCFFQGNAYLCEKLGSWVRDAVEGEYGIDLYGGIGFFSVFMHGRFKAGTLVDTVREHIDLAGRNFTANGVTNFAVCNASAEQFLRMRSPGPCLSDCLVVDPPRAGLSTTVRQAICRYLPATIAYVSCNPATQARDIGYLLRTGTYALERIALFDLYPNTHHMETIALLKRCH